MSRLVAEVRGPCYTLRGLNRPRRMLESGLKDRGSLSMRHDPMMAVFADLLRRVDGLAGERGHVSVPRLRDEIDHIRHVARAFHIDSVEGLAGTLQSALSLQGAGPVVMSYLDLMRDAIAAELPEAQVIPMPVAATVTHLSA